MGSCVANGCLSWLLRGGWSRWVGEDARWDHAVHHMGLWPYLFLGPLPSLFASFYFGRWIESGCLQLQTEAEFNAGIEQVVWRKGRSEKRPQSCLVQLPSVVFPFYNLWLGWEKWEINSLTSALRTLPECLLIRAPLMPSVFSEHLWRSSLKILLSSVLFLKVCFSCLICALAKNPDEEHFNYMKCISE